MPGGGHLRVAHTPPCVRSTMYVTKKIRIVTLSYYYYRSSKGLCKIYSHLFH